MAQLIDGKYRHFTDKMQIFRQKNAFFCISLGCHRENIYLCAKHPNTMKKHLLSLLILLTLGLYTGCQKTITGAEEPEEEETAGSDSNDNPDTREIEFVTPEDSGRVLTVVEAVQAELGEIITVRGYIVGATSRTMNNAKYMPPFEGRSALILADLPPEEFMNSFVPDEELPVCLTDFKQYQDDYNLVDHPEYWGKRVTVIGVKSTYLSVPGLKNLLCPPLE